MKGQVSELVTAVSDVSSVASLTPAGRRILDVASELFYRTGIHAVGVEAIAAEAGVTKKTLYACFGSKDSLIAAYLRARDERWRAFMTEWVDATEASSPADRVLATFDGLAAWAERGNGRGCGFVNALAELPAEDHPARAVIDDQKRWMRSYLGTLVAEAVPDAGAELTDGLFLLHEAAAVSLSSGVPTDGVGQARRSAAILLEAAQAG